MQCNIDNSGARLRRVYGIMLLLTAAMLAALNCWAAIWWLWILVALIAFAGAFCIFEAQKKWCILRAAGLKTPL